MKQTINRISNRIGDRSTRLFAIATLLLVPHAIIRPLILTLGTIYNLRTRKPVNTIYGCICPNCRHKCILHVDGKNLKKAIRLWNHHASHHQRNEQ